MEQIKMMHNELSRKEKTAYCSLCIIPFVFVLGGATIIAKGLLIAVFVAILLTHNIKSAVLSYVFLVFFIPITRGDGITAVAFCGLILLIALGVHFFKKPITKYELLVVVVSIIATIRACMYSKSLSEVSIIYDILVALYIRRTIKNDERTGSDNFIYRMFLIIFLAAIVSAACGVLIFSTIENGRFRIPVGTDRSCIVFVSAMIYPLFYIKNKIWKTISIIFLVFFLFLSVSVTGVVCLLAFFGVYAYHIARKKGNGVSGRQTLFIIMLFVFAAILLFAWNYNTGIQAVDRVMQRLRIISSQVQNGDLESATTGRYGIIQYYLNYYKSFSPLQKLFGGGRTSYYGIAYYRNFSHNSWIDALMFIGIIPLLLLFAWDYCGFIQLHNKQNQTIIILFKTIMFVTGLSVSMFTSSFFLPFIAL